MQPLRNFALLQFVPLMHSSRAAKDSFPRRDAEEEARARSFIRLYVRLFASPSVYSSLFLSHSTIISLIVSISPLEKKDIPWIYRRGYPDKEMFIYSEIKLQTTTLMWGGRQAKQHAWDLGICNPKLTQFWPLSVLHQPKTSAYSSAIATSWWVILASSMGRRLKICRTHERPRYPWVISPSRSARKRGQSCVNSRTVTSVSLQLYFYESARGISVWVTMAVVVFHGGI